LAATPVFGQARPPAPPDPATRAFDLERRGQHGAAAEVYRTILAGNAKDIGALLGLERSLTPNAKLAEMVPELTRALGAGEPSAALYGLGVRLYTAVGQLDSARRMVDRWRVIEPNSEAPYQELGAAALASRDRAAARMAYLLGRERLGKEALAGELAQLATIEGDYPTAVSEWLTASAKASGYRSAAISMLGQVPVAGRPAVLRELERARTPSGERMAASLTIRWGDPVGGIRRLERNLGLLGNFSVEALQDGLDEVRGLRGREAGMAKGIALELLGTRVPNQATRYWLESAQAYADAGDQGSARRLLSRLAGDPKSSPGMAASATSTLVAVLVAEGKLEEATRQFGQLKGVLTEDERQALQIRVAEGWVRAGQLERAEQLVAQDSTIDGLAVRGRIRLFAGDLGGAANLLRFAGPFAGPREAAVSRTTALALLQVIDEDSLPALGSALLKLERRDSVEAARDLEAVATQLPADRGGGEVLLLAGRIQAALGNSAEAERLFGRVGDFKVPASAAAAHLELARILSASDRKPQAIEILEHLLVTYPASAVAPQARRLLDATKGAIPPV
jgi:tetratricopeptide (TPR) repeat protein